MLGEKIFCTRNGDDQMIKPWELGEKWDTTIPLSQESSSVCMMGIGQGWGEGKSCSAFSASPCTSHFVNGGD